MFSQKLRAWRISSNLSQEGLADLAGVSSRTIQAWEEDVSLPSVTTLKAIAILMNVSTDYLLGLSKTKTRLP